MLRLSCSPRLRSTGEVAFSSTVYPHPGSQTRTMIFVQKDEPALFAESILGTSAGLAQKSLVMQFAEVGERSVDAQHHLRGSKTERRQHIPLSGTRDGVQEL